MIIMYAWDYFWKNRNDIVRTQEKPIYRSAPI